MLQSLKLMLPALIPSWRFFDGVAPSPRIEFRQLKTPQDKPERWLEFRPRPQTLSFLSMLKRMFWNPRWNESLFLVSCAERLMDHFTTHSQQEIFDRIYTELRRGGSDLLAMPYLQFRLVFVSRQENDLKKQVMFVSEPQRYDEGEKP